MRNLVVCCDGTWNTADQEAEGVPIPTNVVRIHNVVAETDAAKTEQLKYYHPGVGTEGKWWERVIGGAMGIGLDKNVMSAYRWLGLHYKPGDRAFLFGFSRGAFTVRSLAGMIAKCGLLDLTEVPDAESWARVQRAYHAGYREPDAELRDWNEGWAFHRDEGGNTVDHIHFIGVWDTVGALGVPDDLAILNLIDDPKRYAFHNTELSDRIAHARHAVALDEHRASFTPTLWIGNARSDLKQVWFPGVHSDVGGGYLETGLSDGALLWMIEQADACGLAFHPEMRKQVQGNPRGVLHRSDAGAFAFLPTQPRAVPALDGSSEQALHASVLDRQKDPPITQAPYRRTHKLKVDEERTLSVYARQPWNETEIFLEAGACYRFTASGEWLDRNIACGPDGASDGNFHLGELAHIAGTLLGNVESAFRKVAGNDVADFKGTRRHEGMPWFALVGAIANGGNPRNDGTPQPHQTFKIGSSYTMPPEKPVQKPGYLYCYANDAWNFYDNNRGSVSLTVKRLS